MSLLDDARRRLMQKFGESPNTPDQTKITAEDQPPEEKELAGWVKKRVEDSRMSSNRVAHEGIWMTNVAYVMGFDSIYFDTTNRVFQPLNPGAPIRRNRVYSNLILPACQNRLARLCKVPPRYDVKPNSSQPEDRDAARLGLEVLNDIWERQEINRKRLNLMMSVQQFGHGYLKATFDPTMGQPMPMVGGSNSDIIDPVQGTDSGFDGDIRIDVVSAFEIFPDPLARSWDEIQWLAHCKVRKLDYFRQHYPEKGWMVQEEGPWLLSAQYEARINTLNSLGPSSAGNLQEQMKNAAIEIAYYEKPSTKHKRGRMIIVANGVLLEDQELPGGLIPYCKFDDIVVSGKYYPESVVTHARPLQQQYNRLLQKRTEWTNKMLAGKYLAEKRHALIKEALNDNSGEVVEFTNVPGVTPPTAMVTPPIPSYAYEEATRLKEDLNNVFGLSEISQGKLPAAGIPAVGMQLLVEQDETRIGIEVEQHEHAYANLGKIILTLAGENFKTTRKLKQKQKGGEYDVKEWKGDDLRSNFDVTVVRGSTVPTNKSLRRQEILNAYQQGLLGDLMDPKVREKTLGMLEFGEVSDIWRDRALDMAQIKKTLNEMERGVVPIISELDNHQLHIEEKNAFRKSDRFEQLPPEIQELIQDDIERHVQELVKLQNPGLGAMKTQLEEQMAAGQMPQPDMMGGAPVEQFPGDAALVSETGMGENEMSSLGGIQ